MHDSSRVESAYIERDADEANGKSTAERGRARERYYWNGAEDIKVERQIGNRKGKQTSDQRMREKRKRERLVLLLRERGKKLREEAIDWPSYRLSCQ